MKKTKLGYMIVSLLALSLISGCSGESQEAKNLGFNSVDEMKEIHLKGWHSKNQYNEDLAKKRGFTSVDEMFAADEREKQRLETARKAEQAALTEPWNSDVTYNYFDDGSCKPKQNEVCMSASVFKRACMEASGVTSGAVRDKAFVSYGEDKVLLQGGSVTETNITYGANRKGEMVCTVRLTIEGLVNGNSTRKVFSGNAMKFVANGKGKLLVHYFDY